MGQKGEVGGRTPGSSSLLLYTFSKPHPTPDPRETFTAAGARAQQMEAAHLVQSCRDATASFPGCGVFLR